MSHPYYDDPSNPDVGVILKEREKEQTKRPPMFAVVFHNDDYTTMDFVVDLLIAQFHMTTEKALDIMFDVHEKGKAVAGVFTKDIAETKVVACTSIARSKEHPLMVTMEPVS